MKKLMTAVLAVCPKVRGSASDLRQVDGTKFGRPKNVNDSQHIATARRMKANGHTAKDIAKYLGVSRATLYRYLAEEAAYPATGAPTGSLRPTQAMPRRHYGARVCTLM